MSYQLTDFVDKLKVAHGENLKTVLLYGSAAAGEHVDEHRPKKTLVVLERISPADLQAAHRVANWWHAQGNPVPVYFTSEEIADSSDVFPIEFLDMSRARKVLFGRDPFTDLHVDTQNLRHQLEFELRGKLIRLRRLYIPVCRDGSRLAKLMAESLDSFSILFRYVLELLGREAPDKKRDVVLKLAETLQLEKKVFDRIFHYTADEDVWLEAETTETFATYLAQIERVVEVVDQLESAEAASSPAQA